MVQHHSVGQTQTLSPSILFPAPVGLFRPTLSAASILPAVGALGALVMPYNLFFHSAVVSSRCGGRAAGVFLNAWRREGCGSIFPASTPGASAQTHPALPRPAPPPPPHPPTPSTTTHTHRRPSPATPARLRGVLRYLRVETMLMLLGAFVINLFVICVFAQGFYGTTGG